MLDILRSDAMRGGLKRGMRITAAAAAVTLGPCCRPVIVGDPRTPLRVARTGLAVAKSMHFEDRAETTGAALLRQVAEWARESAGDGTASAIALAHLILCASVNLVGVGFDPSRLRQGIDVALAEADRHLSLLARPMEGWRTLRQVAASAGADAELADLVADAAHRAGTGNLVVVETTEDNGLQLRNSGGVWIATGCAAPQIMTSAGRNRDRHRLNNPLVLVFRGRLSHETMLAPILDYACRLHRPLLVSAEQIPSSFSIAFLQRARELGIRTLVIEAPQDRPGETTTVTALAALVGATDLEPWARRAWEAMVASAEQLDADRTSAAPHGAIGRFTTEPRLVCRRLFGLSHAARARISCAA